MSDRKHEIKKQVKIKREKTEQNAPIVYAQVTRVATDHINSAETPNSTSQVHSSGTLDRVKKVLDLAKHERTTEHEAKQAIQLSAKMFSSTNSQKAQLITYKDANMQSQKGGHSTVTIRRRDGRDIFIRHWTVDVAYAIEKAFNIKYYQQHKSTQPPYFEVVFYGLRDNTVAAALSFEAVFNLCIALAVKRKNKNCYLLGLGSSIDEMAREEYRKEEIQAVENEKRLLRETIVKGMKHKKENFKNNVKASTVVDEDDDDDDVTFVRMKRARTNSHPIINVKTEVKVENDQASTKSKLRNSEKETPEVGWQSFAQLLEFREMAERVAVEYLKEININLSAGSAAERASIYHHSSYRIGKKDACNVDLKRRRLESA